MNSQIYSLKKIPRMATKLKRDVEFTIGLIMGTHWSQIKMVYVEMQELNEQLEELLEDCCHPTHAYLWKLQYFLALVEMQELNK